MSQYTGQRFQVAELYQGSWRGFAVVPAPSADAAVTTARRYGMRPATRPMKASALSVTRR